MALDPSIAGGVTLPQILSPQQQAAQAQQVRRQQQAMQVDDMKLRAGQQELAERDAFLAALRQAPDLSDDTLDNLTRVAPTVAVEFRQKLQQQRTSALAAAKAQAELDEKNAQRGLALLGIVDEDTWPTLAPTIAKLVPDLAPALGPQYDAQRIAQLRNAGVSQAEQLKADRAALEGLFSGKYGALAASLAKVTDPAERAERVRSWGFLGVPKSVLAALEADPASFEMTPDARADNERQAATQQQTAAHQRVLEQQGAQRVQIAASRAAQARTASEPLVSVVGDDGQPVLMPRSQAAGRRPASDRQNLGARGVTSGDAGRIAELDTSLDDVGVLRREIGRTGAVSAFEAAIPKAITDLTGWGTDAQSRQAVIDRVKQVIGKALEGGVLRKEDELKYTKILPTIGDPPAVAKSKLDGLESALRERRTRTLESLEDAGYDVARYKARDGKAPTETQVGGYKVRVKGGQ